MTKKIEPLHGPQIWWGTVLDKIEVNAERDQKCARETECDRQHEGDSDNAQERQKMHTRETEIYI